MAEQIPTSIVELPTKERSKLAVYSLQQMMDGLTGAEENPSYTPIEGIKNPQELQRRQAQVSRQGEYLFALYRSYKNGHLTQPNQLVQRRDVLITAIQQRAKQFSIGTEFIAALGSLPHAIDSDLQDKDTPLPNLATKLMVLESLNGCKDMTEVAQRLEDLKNLTDATTIVIGRRMREIEIDQATRAAVREFTKAKNEGVSDREHVMYREKVAVFGDSHGKGEPPREDAFNVCLGDYMDPKAGFVGIHKYAAVLDPVRFRESTQQWIEAVKTGDAMYIMGNHDMKIVAAMIAGSSYADAWLQDGGREVCDAFGIRLPQGEITDQNYQQFRNAIAMAQDKTLYNFYEMLLTNGKLYGIVNDVYISHTLPSTKNDGSLTPVEIGGIEKAGIETLDELEKSIRVLGQAKATGGMIDIQTYNHAKNRVKLLTQSYFANTRQYTPLWVRDEDIEKVLRDADVADRLISDLDSQAGEKGAHVKAMFFGHVQKGGQTDQTGKIINIDHSYRIFPPGMQKDAYAQIELAPSPLPNSKDALQATLSYPKTDGFKLSEEQINFDIKK